MSIELDINVTPEDYLDWKRHSVTKVFLTQIYKIWEERSENLTSGGTIEQTFADQATAREVGRIEILNAILSLKIEPEEEQ